MVQKQRGSVTVIAIVMLLFLMIVAIAWLPMMTMEKTAASSDYREQQAWYAAEAGYKKAVAALENKNRNWTWLTPEKYIQGSDSSSFGHLSIDGNKVDQDGIWYAVGITENNVDLASNYTPEDSATYQITAVGACQGTRKVIRKSHTLGDNGGTGGGEEPEQPPDAYINDSFITSSGALIINNDIDYDPNNKVYYSGYFGDYTVGGQVSFISGGTIVVNSIKSVDNSRILFIANKNLNMSDPFINADKQLDGGCFLSSAGNMQMLVSSNAAAAFYGQMQSAGLISIGGQSGGTGKLVLRFNKIGEKLKMPNMYYLKAA